MKGWIAATVAVATVLVGLTIAGAVVLPSRLVDEPACQSSPPEPGCLTTNDRLSQEGSARATVVTVGALSTLFVTVLLGIAQIYAAKSGSDAQRLDAAKKTLTDGTSTREANRAAIADLAKAPRSARHDVADVVSQFARTKVAKQVGVRPDADDRVALAQRDPDLDAAVKLLGRSWVPRERRVLAGVDLANADLGALDLRGADFTGAGLNASAMRGTKLQGACFTGADVRHADFTKARMRGATFVDARIDQATFPRRSRPDLTGAITTVPIVDSAAAAGAPGEAADPS